MAVQKHKREDLLADAVAFSRRILLTLSIEGQACELFAGQRAGAGWSFYFDEAPVLQFTASGALRRLYIDDRKLSAENGKLTELLRVPGGTPSRVAHQLQGLAEESEQILLQRCLRYLQLARDALRAGNYRQLGQIPVDDTNLPGDLVRQLDILASGFEVARSAAAASSHGPSSHGPSSHGPSSH
jgi:hypothetical protein